MVQDKIKVYFPGLNALRFLAAFLVFACHVEMLKGRNGYANFYHTTTISELGGSAVTFFFVLSGFLITYLLFVEREVTGDISVKKFYLRRILRIWPLYYLVLTAGFFIIPHVEFLQHAVPQNLNTDFYSKLLLFLFFLPNIAYVYFDHVPYISQGWSIGVEEQFYLIWPILMKKSKNLLKLFIGIIVVISIIKIPIRFIGLNTHGPYTEFFRKLYLVIYFARFECMVIGAMAAYLLYHKKDDLLKIIYHPYLQVFSYVAIIALLATGYKIPIINNLVYSSLFVIIILNVSANKGSILKIENPVLNYLGQISFGIYMYHELAIGIAINGLRTFQLDFAQLMPSGVLYVSALLATIGIASASYYFLEKPFLTFKTRFSKISDK